MNTLYCLILVAFPGPSAMDGLQTMPPDAAVQTTQSASASLSEEPILPDVWVDIDQRLIDRAAGLV